MRSASLFVLFAAPLFAQNGLWVPLSFPAAPSARHASVMAYDSARDRLVLVGGLPTTNETWEHDGATWTQRATSGPSGSAIWYPNASLGVAYDSQRQRTVVVQGDPSNNTTMTWEWNGTTWALRTNGAVPPGRDGFALAYDSVRGRVVLFGGKSNYVGHLADTWEWDGTTWVQRSSGGPSPRKWHAMAFDSARGVTVLFGGRLDATPHTMFADTWEWNGQYWAEHFGVAGPSARRGHAMAFDAARGVTVLCGGDNPYSGGGTYYDTWEWNGVQWTNRQAVLTQATWTAMAYDSQRQRVVAFGGQTSTGGVSDQTQGYVVTTHIAAVAPYGAGCAGPTGVPLLAAAAGSVPRLGGNLNLVLSNLPTGLLSVPLGWLGFDDQNWNGVPLPLALDPVGFPGCSALLAPAAAYGLTNSGGTANWSIAIPFLPAFAGSRFFLQGGVLALGFNPGGAVFTRGLAGTIGR